MPVAVRCFGGGCLVSGAWCQVGVELVSSWFALGVGVVRTQTCMKPWLRLGVGCRHGRLSVAIMSIKAIMDGKDGATTIALIAHLDEYS